MVPIEKAGYSNNIEFYQKGHHSCGWCPFIALEGEDMRIADLLPEEQKKQLHQNRNRLKIEKLSRKDIEELMGVNRDIYERHNGAMRRK